jgi:hypothetical protein
MKTITARLTDVGLIALGFATLLLIGTIIVDGVL